MPSSSSTTPPGPSSSGSTSRHPSPQPYPSPPHRASSSLSAMQRQSLNTVPQLELHRDVSNPFNHTLNYTLSPIPDEGVQRSSYASSSSDRGDDQGSASTRAGPGGAGAGTTEREVHSEDRSAAGRGGSMDRQASNLVASRPPPSPPIPPTAPQPTQRESDSGNSSATAVDPDHTEAVGADDGLPPVIATDYCESPAAVGVVEDAGGLGGVHGSGSSKTRTGGGESGRHSKDSSSSASASTTTPRTPNRHRSASASHSASSNASTGTGTGPRMMSGLSPAIRDKLPSFRKATSSKTRSGSLLPLPATTHREPTNRGSASSARRDRSGNSSGSSTSAMSTSRSATSTARRKRSNLSAHTRQSSAQAYRNSVESETTGSETEVDNTPHSQRDRQGSGTGHSDRPSGQHSQAPKSAFDGISGNELAAGHAAASLVRRMTGGSVERQKRQHSRASLGARMGSRRTTGAGHTSDYQSQARMVRERDRTASDNDILRKQLEEDGLMMDEEGHVVNRDRGWSNPPSRGGSGGVKGDNGEKDGQKQGGGHGDGQDQTEEGEGGDDVPVPPPAPRRTTLGTSVSYTSTIVYTSIFADIKNDSIAMAGEFVGTILFLITSLGAVASMHQEGDGPPDPQSSTIENLIGTFYKAFATGTALYGTASIFYRFTGSIFNPSVSLALALTGVIRPVRFILVSTSQMLGGIVAAYILHGLIPGQTEINLKLAASANIAQGLFIESFATTTLILTVLMLGVEKHLVTPHAPLGFGLTLSASMLFAMPYTGAGINVARAFGPALVQGFQPYHWIYWLGPTIGAFLASAFYVFLRYIQYWEVNPGQDSTQPLAGPPESGRKLRKKAGLKKREVLSPKG